MDPFASNQPFLQLSGTRTFSGPLGQYFLGSQGQWLIIELECGVLKSENQIQVQCLRNEPVTVGFCDRMCPFYRHCVVTVSVRAVTVADKIGIGQWR